MQTTEIEIRTLQLTMLNHLLVQLIDGPRLSPYCYAISMLMPHETRLTNSLKFENSSQSASKEPIDYISTSVMVRDCKTNVNRSKQRKYKCLQESDEDLETHDGHWRDNPWQQHQCHHSCQFVGGDNQQQT